MASRSGSKPSAVSTQARSGVGSSKLSISHSPSDVATAQARRAKFLPTVQGSHGFICDRPKQRKMKLIDVKVQNVEFVRELAQKHRHIVRNWIAYVGI